MNVEAKSGSSNRWLWIVFVAVVIVGDFYVGHGLKSINAILKTGSDAEKAKIEAEKTRINAEAFDAGARLGYTCRVVGGTDNDLMFIISCYNNGNPQAVNQWLNMHTKAVYPAPVTPASVPSPVQTSAPPVSITPPLEKK